MLRHQFLFQFTMNMGWIGVDLFFVLSGFLISGLLFKEYLKYGNIKPLNFLIRRGFKIYPIYYLSYLIYLIPLFQTDHFSIIRWLSDMTFTQNYIGGWGYAYSASWSLAVEEHFYLSLVFFLWIALKNDLITLKVERGYLGASQMELFLLAIIVLCLVFRISSNVLFPHQSVRNFTMTHLRIDSLLSGVLLAYLYYFRLDYLTKLFRKFKLYFYGIAFLGIIWTPFIDPVPSFFVKTIGFTLLYISFSILLMIFLLNHDINQKLNSIFSKLLVEFVRKVGVCSYSIYIIHTFINSKVAEVQLALNITLSPYMIFVLTSFLSFRIGMVMTYSLEKYFLRIRDKYYPTRANEELVVTEPLALNAPFDKHPRLHNPSSEQAESRAREIA